MKNFLVLILLVSVFYANGQEDLPARAPRLKVVNPDTDAERKELAKPFYGVTNKGNLVNGLYSIESTGVNTEGISKVVSQFLKSLSSEQRETCMFPIDADEWRRWSNIDFYRRKGIGIPDLNENQKSLAFEILEVSLSPSGLKKAEDIFKMEDYLAYLAQDFEKLGGEKYWLTFMGEPSDSEPWGWQIDGHHLVINYFILGDQVVMTPTFMGSEPTYIDEGKNAGTRTYEKEEKLGLEFYHTLNEKQKELATLLDRKEYNYNQTESYQDNAVVPFAGIKVDQLSSNQKKSLKKLIWEYVGNIKEGHAEIRMAEVMDHLNNTYFAWIGKADTSSPFYYRIHSPVILIEFDHQKPVFLEGDLPTRKHIHTVVRTPNGNDYGKDLLRQHLEHGHSH